MLEVDDLHAGYGKSQVLQGVRLQVHPGEIVGLLGRNGSGRSTLVKAVMGLVPARGTVRWHGESLLGLPAHRIARRGLGYVPEQRDVFAGLTVQQNLLLGRQRGGRPGSGPAWSMDELYGLFPPLVRRRDTDAGVLSGGEQQMLTLCRTLMGAPALLLVDEPTEGLAPAVVQQVAGCLRALQQRGVGVLLVEQKLTIALDVSQRCLVMGHGRIVFDGSPAALHACPAVIAEWLAV